MCACIPRCVVVDAAPWGAVPTGTSRGLEFAALSVRRGRSIASVHSAWTHHDGAWRDAWLSPWRRQGYASERHTIGA